MIAIRKLVHPEMREICHLTERLSDYGEQQNDLKM